MHPATVAVLNEAGYRTLNDIIDLEREDFLRLAGIAPEEADRIMSLLDELTTEDAPAVVAGHSPTSSAAESGGPPPRAAGCFGWSGSGSAREAPWSASNEFAMGSGRTRWRS